MIATTETEEATIAYSYQRFSTPEQSAGDSLRRQTQLAAELCKRRGWHLDTTLVKPDKGVSAFKGGNLNANLGEFLSCVQRGVVKPGSVLIVESFDRISREGIDRGYDTIKGILKAGIGIATLSPERFFDESATRSLSRGALEILMILERACEESEMKSRRVSAAWEAKRNALYQGLPQPIFRGDRVGGTGILTRKLPGWIRVQDGRLELDPAGAAAVRRIFELCIGGSGAALIVRTLTQEGVKPIGVSGKWTSGYIRNILKDRRVLGEFRPRGGNPVANYFPAVLDEQTHAQAMAAMRGRKGRPGRTGTGSMVNVFASLMRSATDGSSIQLVMRTEQRRGVSHVTWALANADGLEGRGPLRSFPYLVAESAILSMLKEVPVADVIGVPHQGQSATIAGELAAVTEQIHAIEKELANTKAVPSVMRVLAGLEEQRSNLAEQLTQARIAESAPLSDAFGELTTLADVVATADNPNEIRLRIRGSLRRCASGIVMLTLPSRTATTWAMFQVYLMAGGHRTYVVRSTRTVANARRTVPGSWEARSFLAADGIDLRKPDDVKQAEELLKAIASQP